MSEIMIKYNNSLHRSIGMTPNEAWNNPENANLTKNNLSYGQYSLEFKKTSRGTFKIGDQVYIQANELDAQEKLEPKYNGEGKVVWVMENDTYLVNSNKKLIKLSHSQLKLKGLSKRKGRKIQESD